MIELPSRHHYKNQKYVLCVGVSVTQPPSSSVDNGFLGLANVTFYVTLLISFGAISSHFPQQLFYSGILWRLI